MSVPQVIAWSILYLLAAAFMLTFTVPLLLSFGMAQDGWLVFWSIVISLAAAAFPFFFVWSTGY